MTQPAPARMRHCRDCDGFSVVAITTGDRLPDGTRTTLCVVCRTCSGSGTTPLHARAADTVGSRA
jgi:hypothetical protein